MNYNEKFLIKTKKFIDLFFLDEFKGEIIPTIEKIISNKNSVSFFDLLKKWDTSNLSHKDFTKDVVCGINNSLDDELFKKLIIDLKPWRKGPFKLNDLLVDSEWQCQYKWNRISKEINFSHASILDVGAGNGYYMYKMLGDSADICLGLDPHLLYFHQNLVLNYFFQEQKEHLLPLGWQECNKLKPIFDYIVCMGVLYHQKDPEKLLKFLKLPLKNSGSLILETLVIDSDIDDVLTPKNRYAAMKNVYQIPSTKRLIKWLKQSNYKNIEILNINQTSTNEQRQTIFSSGMSLIDFLDPNDNSKTIEGYPRPTRIVLKARI